MKALIIEDEKPAAKRLCKLILDLEPGSEILAVLDTIEDSIQWFAQHPPPQVVFMDIHLADGNSFEIFKKIKISSPIIFITAYDEYAISAFKVNSVDYLLKPVKPNELALAIKKLNSLFINAENENINSLIETSAKKYKDRFVVKLGNKLIPLDTGQIAYFYSRDKMTFICDAHGKQFPIDLSLDKIEGLLNPLDFFRINRQILANFSAVRDIQTAAKSRLSISLLPPAPVETQVSSERSSAFKNWLKRK